MSFLSMKGAAMYTCAHNWESTVSLSFTVDTNEAYGKVGLSGPGLQTSLP